MSDLAGSGGNLRSDHLRTRTTIRRRRFGPRSNKRFAGRSELDEAEGPVDPLQPGIIRETPETGARDVVDSIRGCGVDGAHSARLE